MADEKRTPADALTPQEKEYSDGRNKGAYTSEYSKLAWLQIALEASYLGVLCLAAGFHMVAIAASADKTTFNCPILGYVSISPDHAKVIKLWLAVFFSGVLGGTVFSIKWLYHSVAWKLWHRDRLVWRIYVPLLGGVLACFTGMMILAGIVPLLSKESFTRILTASGFGFFVGLFADNFLAGLHKLADSVLGTLGRKP